MRSRSALSPVSMFLVLLVGCGGGVDAMDAGPLDAGPLDAGPLDAGPLDAGPDAARPDVGPEDGNLPDAAPPVDGGAPDAPPDAEADASALDAAAEGFSLSGTILSVSSGAAGLAGTGVAAAASPQGALYASDGTGVVHEVGTNVLAVTAADLGLLETSDIDAVSREHGVAAGYTLFSVADTGDVGLPNSDARRQVVALEVPGDVFASATPPTEWNAVLIDEARLGLAPELAAGGVVDDLNALEAEVAAAGPTPLFFSVAADAEGAPGSALAALDPAERGCTLFRATGDGSHAVAWTCAELGLAPGDDVDALHITTERIAVSVTAGAQGAAGSALRALVDAAVGVGAGVLEVRRDDLGVHLVVPASEYGLEDDDELDALHVLEVAAAPRSTLARSCTLETTGACPLSTEGTRITDCTAVGTHTAACRIARPPNALLSRYGTSIGYCLFDLTTCDAVEGSLHWWTSVAAGPPRLFGDFFVHGLEPGVVGDPWSGAVIVQSERSPIAPTQLRLHEVDPGGVDELITITRPPEVTQIGAVTADPSDSLVSAYDALCLFTEDGLGEPTVHPCTLDDEVGVTVGPPLPAPCHGDIGADIAVARGRLHIMPANESYVCEFDAQTRFHEPVRDWATAPDNSAFRRFTPGEGAVVLHAGTEPTDPWTVDIYSL